MDFKKFLSTYSGVLKENRFYRIVLGVLLAANLLLGAAVLTHKEVVVLVPPDLRGETRIAPNRGDRHYQESWGLFFALLLGNVTPRNIEFVVEAVEAYLSPQIYQDLMKDLYAQAKNVKQSNLSISFEPREVMYDEQTERVLVKGQTVLRGSYGKPQMINKTFEFGIEVKNYYPRIVYLDAYEKKPKEGADGQ
ncbi:MAG: hypothetical protein JRI66_03270 [Deltaproteobacteria bacterium]|nr:hypothetical protein [Deltaproteobacteria bacterium]